MSTKIQRLYKKKLGQKKFPRHPEDPYTEEDRQRNREEQNRLPEETQVLQDFMMERGHMPEVAPDEPPKHPPGGINNLPADLIYKETENQFHILSRSHRHEISASAYTALMSIRNNMSMAAPGTGGDFYEYVPIPIPHIMDMDPPLDYSIYNSWDGETGHIYLVDADGTGEDPLTEIYAEFLPDLMPAEIRSMARDLADAIMYDIANRLVMRMERVEDFELDGAVNVVEEPENKGDQPEGEVPVTEKFLYGETPDSPNLTTEHNYSKPRRVEGKKKPQGAILALIPTSEAAKAIAASMPELDIDPDELHVTLVYLGKDTQDLETVMNIASQICDANEELHCRLQGLGIFDEENKEGLQAFYASVDAKGMAALRTELEESLLDAGIDVPTEYDFTPHMTLGFVHPDDVSFLDGSPGAEWISDKIVLMAGDEHTDIMLGGVSKKAEFGLSLDDLSSPGDTLWSQDRINESYHDDNKSEDKDLHLGSPEEDKEAEVEPPYSNGLGAIEVDQDSADDDKKFNITRGASISMAHILAKIASAGNIQRLLGFTPEVSQAISSMYPYNDMPAGKIIKLMYVGGGGDVKNIQPEEVAQFQHPLLEELKQPNISSKKIKFINGFNGAMSELEQGLQQFKTLDQSQVAVQCANGFKWVSIPACDTNTLAEQMQHCTTFAEGEQAYSLRDAKNQPHVTAEVNMNMITQIQGKQNELPDKKYWPYVKQLMDSLDLGIAEDVYEEIVQLAPERAGKGTHTKYVEEFMATGDPNILLNAPTNIQDTIVSNKEALPEVLAVLSRDTDPDVKAGVAANLNTPPEVLAALSKDANVYVRWDVARNTNTPPEVLAALSKDAEGIVHASVARNTNTPPEVLAALSEDTNADVKWNVSRNPSTPPEILVVLSKDTEESIIRGCAYNPSTPPEVLAALSINADMAVRRAVAESPNTPPEVLLALSKDANAGVRYSVTYNPSTPPEVLLALSKDADTMVRESVALNPSTPPEVLLALSKDADARVRLGVSRNLKTPPEVLLALSKDAGYNVANAAITALKRRNIVASVSMAHILAKIASAGNIQRLLGFTPEVSQAIASMYPYNDMPAGKIIKLMYVGGGGDVKNIQPEEVAQFQHPLLEELKQPNISSKKIKFINGFNGALSELEQGLQQFKTLDQSQVAVQCANGFKWVSIPACDTDALAEQMQHCTTFAEGEQAYSLRDAKNQPHITAEVNMNMITQIQGKQNEIPNKKYWSYVKQLMDSLDLGIAEDVYEEIVQLAPERAGKGIHTKYVEEFMATGDANILLNAPANVKDTIVYNSKNILPEALTALSKDADVGIRQGVASNPSTPPEALTALSKDTNMTTVHYVASNPSTPPEVLLALSKDANAGVRQDITENPSAPPELLVALSKDADAGVRRCVAYNPSTPPEVLLALSKDADEGVRWGVSHNLKTPPEVLAALSKDADVGVRRCVADNQSTPPEVLAALSKDADAGVRQGITYNPSTPPELLVALSKDADVGVRRCVADNQSTPPEVLLALSKDADTRVRWGVSHNLKTPPELLVALSKDADEDVSVSATRSLKRLNVVASVSMASIIAAPIMDARVIDVARRSGYNVVSMDRQPMYTNVEFFHMATGAVLDGTKDDFAWSFVIRSSTGGYLGKDEIADTSFSGLARILYRISTNIPKLIKRNEPSVDVVYDDLGEKESVALPDGGAIDENKYEDPAGSRQDYSIPRAPALSGPVYGK